MLFLNFGKKLKNNEGKKTAQTLQTGKMYILKNTAVKKLNWRKKTQAVPSF